MGAETLSNDLTNMLADLAIAPLDDDLRGRVSHAIDVKTKPPGSLGQIEALALQLALAQGTDAPSAKATPGPQYVWSRAATTKP